ncbi:MAG: bifunctional alpha,alpha-trehalose-phosphate synthase (UDP-forming)/trehalose-phosphatase [Veillonellaceae bacterium]|nr:bifunctional alpha,alpha-trehalose-phosphate synthase (UDP-forming)/trehalose-phosphatase [Veillonellaceae bacterium]
MSETTTRKQARLIIVSNRLPMTVSMEEGKMTLGPSAGGLVSALGAYLARRKEEAAELSEYLWVGWPGNSIAEADQPMVRRCLRTEHGCDPVFLATDVMDKFYLGFCNKTVWPLFHYFPTLTVYEEEMWEVYEAVNRQFCEVIAQLAQPDDVIWIHDYHFMLLPAMLRERCPNNSIGFFLHIPFPAYEVFRMLPRKWAAGLVEGLLGSDVVGFHTVDYVRHFLTAVLRLTGYQHQIGRLMYQGREVRADAFPIGIDFEKYYDTACLPKIRREAELIRRKLVQQKAILSVDRLDYTKGIAKRLRAYELFLERHSEWHQEVIMLLLVVPSRIGVDRYQDMRREIDELVGRINGRFGDIGWAPIAYLYKNLGLQALSSLYSAADVALVTPLRDGMNLVAKEFVASRTQDDGVLILSEMAGAARELPEALIINPNSREEMAEAIHQALVMPASEQAERIRTMRDNVRRYDVHRWGWLFLHALQNLSTANQLTADKRLTEEKMTSLVRQFALTNRRALIFDYDGTLVPLARTPDQAVPGEYLLRLLRALTADQRNDVTIVSGRPREFLQQHFGDLRSTLVAEHGAWLKRRGGIWRKRVFPDDTWKQRIVPLLEYYVERLPASFLEEKECSVAWHYRLSDAESADFMAQELKFELSNLLLQTNMEVLEGNKVLEVRAKAANKGSAVLAALDDGNYELILAAGDDWTDEDMFQVLPGTAMTIRVGVRPTAANYLLEEQHELITLLEKILMAELV